jgi:hypothetical protein
VTADHAFVAGPISRSPAVIRAALRQEDRELFAEEYRSALEAAKATFSLQDVDAVVERWWRFANLSAGHDRSVHIAGQVLAGGDVDGVVADLAALRG